MGTASEGERLEPTASESSLRLATILLMVHWRFSEASLL